MLEVIDASGFITLQDSGRSGFKRFGVPASGPMDWFAHQAANYLAGNPLNESVLEIGMGDVTFRARKDCVIAVTGAGYEVVNYVWTFPLWTSFYVRAGWVIQVKKGSGGNWAYLAAAGGFEIKPIMGSRSTYLQGNLGEVISTGMQLRIGKPQKELSKLAAKNFPLKHGPAYSQSPLIDVIMGPQEFSKQAVKKFLTDEYSLTSSFDRMGYRLEGSAIERLNEMELISEGMTIGSVQVPSSGQPIVMMADAPTTGGYPKIATVTYSSLPVLAQCEAGKCKIHFREVSVSEAQDKYRNMMNGLHECGYDED